MAESSPQTLEQASPVGLGGDGPSFPGEFNQTVVNFRTQRAYRLSRLDDRFPIEARGLKQIEVTCNQPAVYSLLFEERLEGALYGLADAERFVAWGRRGWREGTHFVFLLSCPAVADDGANEIVGAIDIKSNRLDSAEIGYWLNADHSGVMTNTVLRLVTVARDAGYRLLYAIVRVTNRRSASVLERAGFLRQEPFEKNGRQYDRFEIRLQ